MKKIEYRELGLEPSSVKSLDDKLIVEGKAICFDTETVIYVDYHGTEYKEKISSTALDGADMSSVPLAYNHNHEKAMLLAKLGNGTLQLEKRQDGLYFTAELRTNLGKDVYDAIKAGEINKCSFGFICEEDQWNDKEKLRTVTKISKLTDVSIVDYPAYEQTSVNARNQGQVNYFKDKAEAAQREIELEKRKRLAISLEK